MHRVLILGGGFGGIATAVALRARLETEDEVVLVERRPTFMMGLRKNWALLGESGIGEGERPLSLLADRGVQVIQDSVDTIDPEAKAAVVVDLGVVRSRFVRSTNGVDGLGVCPRPFWI